MKELIVESNQSAAQNVTSHLSNVLKQHKRTGTGEKSFTCSACDKTFTPSNGLLYYEQTHSGKRPFSCSKCDK